jgi:hypothetical protein
MPSTLQEATGRQISFIWQACGRRKTGSSASRRRRNRDSRSQPGVESAERTCHQRHSELAGNGDHSAERRSPWELGATALVPYLPLAVFVVAGEETIGHAGPAAILSVILAAAISCLTGKLARKCVTIWLKRRPTFRYEVTYKFC